MNNINQEERAFRTWDILVAASERREILRYKELGERLGIHHRALYWPLDLIHQYCIRENLPPLTILVVNATGLPGKGFTAWDLGHFDEGCKEVFEHPWEREDNPFSYAVGGVPVETLAEAILDSAAAADELYQRVKVRGAAQELFRAALLKAYGEGCAMCDFRFRKALDAAHIKPWAASEAGERLDVRNGLLLCRNHHALFDMGMLTVGADYTVRVHPEVQPQLESLEGMRLTLPTDRRHWPAPRFLEWHRENVDFEEWMIRTGA